MVAPLHDHGYRSNVGMRTPRETEYDVFSCMACMLRQADNVETIQAVHKKTELWALLACNLAEPGNSLSDQGKAGLISLTGVSERHGHAMMAGNASSDVLIDLSVMRGLRGKGAA